LGFPKVTKISFFFKDNSSTMMNLLIAAAEAGHAAAEAGQSPSILEQFGYALPKLIAQAVNFLFIYFVLSKFAFGPIVAMLQERKKRIADGEAKLEKIARDLAEADENAKNIITKANTEGARLVKEANDSAKSLAENKQQEAIHEANLIIAKAREASQLEKEQLTAQLKREFGRMVADATSRVTGKVLNSDDQARINRETAGQVSA
jgi:F-type H+-transporting ATPase subunit b